MDVDDAADHEQDRENDLYEDEEEDATPPAAQRAVDQMVLSSASSDAEAPVEVLSDDNASRDSNAVQRQHRKRSALTDWARPVPVAKGQVLDGAALVAAALGESSRRKGSTTVSPHSVTRFHVVDTTLQTGGGGGGGGGGAVEPAAAGPTAQPSVFMRSTQSVSGL